MVNTYESSVSTFLQMFCKVCALIYMKVEVWTEQNIARVKINCSCLDLNQGLQPLKRKTYQCAISPDLKTVKNNYSLQLGRHQSSFDNSRLIKLMTCILPWWLGSLERVKFKQTNSGDRWIQSRFGHVYGTIYIQTLEGKKRCLLTRGDHIKK